MTNTKEEDIFCALIFVLGMALFVTMPVWTAYLLGII
jgi:hypothetical protein